MKKTLVRLMGAALACVLMLVPAFALASEPESKTIEETIRFKDDKLEIVIDQWCYAFKKTDLRFFVAHVHTTDPLQLRTAFAGEEYSRDNVEATSAIAERHDAVLAINGDYYNFKDKNGLVIRNGVLYRDKPTTRDILLVMKDGTFKAMPRGRYPGGQGEQLIAEGVEQAFMFGPLLVDEGEIVELPEKYFISMKDNITEPRTAIGQVDDNHYVFIVVDGRRDGWSENGMTLKRLQQIFVEEGCRIAYNLDGGGSSTLIFNGERINKSSGSRERDVSDIIYITK